MKIPPLFVVLCLLPAILLSCKMFEGPTGIVAEGVVLNKYTRQPLVGVAVIVRRFKYGSYGNTSFDSVAAAFTDFNGHYELKFDASATGSYRIKIGLYRSNLYDLTTYTGNYNASDGFEVKPGSNPIINFEAVPYLPIQVIVKADKRGNSLFSTGFRADDRDGQGFYTNTIVYDTATTNQNIFLRAKINFVPNRSYIFYTERAVIHCKAQYQCQSSNVISSNFVKFIAYNDTSTIYIN